MYINPAEFLLNLTSSDFARGNDDAQLRIEKLQSDWQDSPESMALVAKISAISAGGDGTTSFSAPKSGNTFVNIVLALLHRSFIKSYRDVVAYGIRFAMYIGSFALQFARLISR